MKTILWVMLFMCATALCAEVLFYDNFDRAEGGPVGNEWVNVGPINPIIENGAMKVESGSLQGVRRDFTALGITSGIYYVSYDWKINSNNWLADAFPNGTITYLRHDYEGKLYYDNTSDFSNPVEIGNLALNTWANFKIKVNLSTDRFSIWINNTLVADNIAGALVGDFTRFTFRAGSGSSVTQYVDNFIVYNDTPPAVPTNLTAIGAVNDIILNWTGTHQEYLTYRIYRKTSSPADVFLAEVPGTQTTFTDLTAAPNTDYFYRVKAVSMSTIESGFSNEATAHLQPVINIPQQTIELNINSLGAETSSITISNNGNYPLNYDITSSMDQNGLGKSLYFDGVDDGKYVLLNNFGAQQVFTVSMWIKPEAIQGAYANILDCNHSGTNNWVAQRDGLGSSWNWGYTGNLFNLTANAWQHLAFTASNGLLKTYVNGILVRQITRPLFNYALTPNLNLGRWNSGGRTFHGWIDDVHISRSVRYTGNFDPSVPIPPDGNTYGYWTFDEASGSICYDQSTANNNAQIIGNVIRSDDIPDTDWLSINPSSGQIESGQSMDIDVSVISNILGFGTHYGTLNVHSNDPINPAVPVEIIFNVDTTPPQAVTGLVVDPDSTDSNQIGLYWTANALADSVDTYIIFRKGRDESLFRQVGIVPRNQLWYIDNQFTGLDSTYVYYQVKAFDWVGNLGPEGISLIAALERFLAPSNVQLSSINNRDTHLTWSPVTQTISGLPGTPSCYVIYKSQYPSPITDFDFLSISFTNEFTHQWALFFQPLNRLFYIVTAYGGDLGRMQSLVAQKREWRFGELERALHERSAQNLNILK